MKTFWKICSALLASVLSLILFLTLILLPVVSFVTDSVDPGNLVKLIFSAELKKPSPSGNGISLSKQAAGKDMPEAEDVFETLQTLVQDGIIDIDALIQELHISKNTKIDEEKLIKDLSQSGAVEAIIEAYAEDFLNAATGAGAAPSLTAEKVMAIVAPHMPELVTIVENNLPADVEIDRDKLSAAIDKVTSAILPELVEALPPADAFVDSIVDAEIPQEVFWGLHMLRKGYLRLAVIGFVFLLAVLIFLLRLPGFSGLYWVGTDALSGALCLALLGLLLQTDPINYALSTSLSTGGSLLLSLLEAFCSTLFQFAVIYGIAGIVLIGGNYLIKMLTAKQKP